MLILHFFNAFIRLAGMPRRILIIQMNLNSYNSIETFGSMYYFNFWYLYLFLIFIGLLFKHKRIAAKQRGTYLKQNGNIPPFRGI